MSTKQCTTDELLEAARAARRATKDEAYFSNELRLSVLELGRILNVRVSSHGTDVPSLVDELDDLDDVAQAILNGDLAKRIQSLSTERDERAQAFARAAGALWHVVQELQSDVAKDEEETEQEEEAKEA